MSKKNLLQATAVAFATALTISIGCASQGGQGMCGGGSSGNTLNCPSGTHQDPNQPNCTNPTSCCITDTQAQLNRVDGGGTTGSSSGGSGEQSQGERP